MPIRRPRRIFRSSSRGAAVPAVPRAVLAGLFGTVAGAAVVLLGLPADLFGRAPPAIGTLRAVAVQVAVIDGETLLLHDTVIRLQGISAPARGRACGTASSEIVAAGDAADCGAAAANALAGLVRGKDVACRLDGRDRQGTAQGFCEAGGVDLNRMLVAHGWARAGDPGFGGEEAQARRDHLGLWRNAL